MKNKALKVIRFTSLLLVLLLFLPTFSLWAVEAPKGRLLKLPQRCRRKMSP